MLGSLQALNAEPRFLQALYLKLSAENVQTPPAKFGVLRAGRMGKLKKKKFLFGQRTSPAPSAKCVETRSDTKPQVRICCPVRKSHDRLDGPRLLFCVPRSGVRSCCARRCHGLKTLDCTQQSPCQRFTHLQLLQDLSMKYNLLWNNLVSKHLT